MPAPADANVYGDVFGGWIMSYVDIAGAIPAAQVPTFLGALANPAYLAIPASAFPLFGLIAQPTANNGDFAYFDSEDDGVTWRLPVSGGEIAVQPTYTWQSKVFFSDDNDLPALQSRNIVPDRVQDEYQDAYGLLNLRVRYTPDSANWGVEAFGENVVDEDYIKDAGNTGDSLGLPTFIAGEPRTYGATVSVRY